MISGKVHGSLARAGKVKGQTPKVRTKYICIVETKKLTYMYFNMMFFIGYINNAVINS